MNKKLEKAIKTMTPVATGVIMLIGKSAGKMKDALKEKLPEVKVISVNNETDDGKDREIMKRDILKKAAMISIPVVATGVGLLIKSFKELDEKKKINDEINGIDDDGDTPYKLEPIQVEPEQEISGTAKDRKSQVKKVSYIRSQIMGEISYHVYTVLQCKEIDIDKDELEIALTNYFGDHSKEKLIGFIISHKDIYIAKNIIEVYNNIIANYTHKYGLKQIKNMMIPNDISKEIINTMLTNNISEIIEQILGEGAINAIGRKRLNTTISKTIEINDNIILLELFTIFKIEASIQLDILFKVHDYLEKMHLEYEV